MSLFEKIVIILTVILVIIALVSLFKVDANSMKKNIFYNIKLAINTFVRNQEQSLKNKMFKGQLSPLEFKWNKFLNNLKSDFSFLFFLPLTQFKALLYISSAALGFIVSFLIFSNIYFAPIVAVMIFIFIICIMFSSTIRVRYKKLIDSIATENILSANIKDGFVADVKLNINTIPTSIRSYYEEFIYNMTNMNYTMTEALALLDMETGYYSTNFLSNVNAWEVYHEEGFDDIFKDVVELNGIRKLARDKMEMIIQQISIQFIVSFILSYGLLIVEMILYERLRTFYLANTIGQTIFVIDLLLLVIIYLVINILKGKEL